MNLKKWDKLMRRPVTPQEAQQLEARTIEIMEQEERSRNFAEMQAASELRNKTAYSLL